MRYGESEKYGNFTDKAEKVEIYIKQDAVDKNLVLADYTLLVTSETEISDQNIYNTYHNLWPVM